MIPESHLTLKSISSRCTENLRTSILHLSEAVENGKLSCDKDAKNIAGKLQLFSISFGRSFFKEKHVGASVDNIHLLFIDMK
jgi:hypothetical protein